MKNESFKKTQFHTNSEMHWQSEDWPISGGLGDLGLAN